MKRRFSDPYFQYGAYYLHIGLNRRHVYFAYPRFMDHKALLLQVWL